MTSLISKGNDVGVVAICLSDFLPPLQPAPFHLMCQLRCETGWGSQSSGWNRMRVPERLFLPVTWDLGAAQRTKLQVTACPGGKAPVGVQQLPSPVRSLAGRAVHDYLCRGTPDIYTRKHLFHSWVMRRKGRIGWNSHGDARLLNCWLSWIFCVRVQ